MSDDPLARFRETPPRGQLLDSERWRRGHLLVLTTDPEPVCPCGLHCDRLEES
jgi:hypothetical protein